MVYKPISKILMRILLPISSKAILYLSIDTRRLVNYVEYHHKSSRSLVINILTNTNCTQKTYDVLFLIGFTSLLFNEHDNDRIVILK